MFFGKWYFCSKKQLEDKLKFIRKETNGRITDVNTIDLLTHMTAKHSAKDTYCSSPEDIAGFSVRLQQAGRFAPTKQFILHRVNGTESSISFDGCSQSEDQIQKNTWTKALRCEIQPQINEFRRRHRAPEQCPNCERKAACEVDHLEFFSHLSASFLEHLQQQKIPLSNVVGMGAEDSRIGCPWGPDDNTSLWLQDRQQAAMWAKFHQEHASFQYLCGPCNRKRKRPRISLSEKL
jgi:hypothetical protein